ncbi:hypothetical protein Mx8p84 [Myxococcus phage Mx8]|uniref:p84 n=1 Tax=Myxococcus phage Mx8 TaxID=49964 RepID=Q94MN5_9CAUD|nr:hypothetical protein Mx8p84 [Myxococcus phage Mx8]AAK94419.1 p84 [Myxococcus phage Mx8]
MSPAKKRRQSPRGNSAWRLTRRSRTGERCWWASPPRRATVRPCSSSTGRTQSACGAR